MIAIARRWADAALGALFAKGATAAAGMTVSEIGTCESCSQSFSYDLLHSGFADSAYAYCERCGLTAIISGWTAHPEHAPLEVHKAITTTVEPFLSNCPCGGRFGANASPRCSPCALPLSAELGTSYIEANAAGTAKGWRWQRDWTSLYGIVIDKRMLRDPWLTDAP